MRDAETGRVLAERGETIGRATNNVAEYRGLIAALELAREHAPQASVEVRMDSQLVIEQMAGRWKVKHQDIVPLSEQARRLAPAGTVWTWVPRERNAAADALANAALDEQERTGRPALVGVVPRPSLGWAPTTTAVGTTIHLLRHGVTPLTDRKVFSGSGGDDPALTERGVEQAARAAGWLARHGGVEAVVTSPVRRARETAGVVAEALGLDVEVEPGFAEADFGDWDGHTFAEIRERWPHELSSWLDDTAVGPPGGESMDAVQARVTAARDRLLERHAGRSVVVVSHVTPIKMIVSQALGVSVRAIYRMELAPAAISTVQWWSEGVPSLRSFSVVPE